MARLDDITTLPTNLELSGSDSFVVADKSFRGGTFAKQIPAAIIAKYSHAFLFNFDGATLNFDNRLRSADILGPFGSADRIVTDAVVIVTKAFVGLGSSPKVDLGLHSSDTDGDGAPDNIVNNVPLNEIGAGIFNSSSESDPSSEGTGEAAEGILIPSDNKIRVSFDATGGHSFINATAGQVVILVNVINVNDYIDIVPAFD